MIIHNYHIEFGYELIGIIPFAYWVFRQGQLEKTISSFDSAPLYYFSPCHEETPERRHSRNWVYVKKVFDNGYVHRTELDTSRWIPPPYKKHYKNDRFVFDKPILVVTNKYNLEWKRSPVNFLNIDTLKWIFAEYKDKYKIIYNRFRPEMGYDDTVDTLDLNEWRMVEDIGIETIQDLKPEDLSYNEFQLMLYANCDKYITVQGGTSVLASFFGGDNIIFARAGMELRRGTYYSWYHLLGGSKIYPVSTYENLKKQAKSVL